MTHTLLALPYLVSIDFDHLLGGGHIGSVAVKDLKGGGQSFLCRHKTDADLRAVGTAVPAVSSFGLGVALGGAFKIGRRDVVEEEVEGCAEEFAVAILEMFTQIDLYGAEGHRGRGRAGHR